MTRALGTLGILVLDDEPNVRRALARLDLGPAMQLLPAATAAEADALVDEGGIDVVLVDEHLGPGQPRGLDWLARLQAKDPDCFRIIFTGAADLDSGSGLGDKRHKVVGDSTWKFPYQRGRVSANRIKIT
jgi:DNA-binding NtrC family response regulator